MSTRSKVQETYSFVMTFSIFEVYTNIYFDVRAYGGVHIRLTISRRKKPTDRQKTKTFTKTFQIRDRAEYVTEIAIANC